ncbi:helix-turn-helix transcriptional regulator [Roseomonas populi]|uniref:LuxR C-terminal-related transcriptional regulator n=1 Tax=Roseomonas populi TaxID=3121582 RepID=A0ABT1X9D9_9PROT|nr:LuxR C-terminal-related transcriptional regulator [Roseomonas pecuniae]MCR0984728.1 LuxR C-terminal-related transcriptional regulator [Roseomonas pecuniae]
MASRHPPLQTVVEGIYAAAADPAGWPGALTLLADHVGGTGAMLVFNAPAEKRAAIVTGRLRPDLTDLYMRDPTYADNPWTTRLTAVPMGRPGIASRYVDPALLRRTAAYADLLVPQKIEDLIVLTHPAMARGRASGGFGVTLSQRGAERAEDAAHRLGRLAPHLYRGLEISLRMAPHADGRAQLDTALHAMPGAALVLDGTGRILLANPPAEALLRASDGLVAGTDGGPCLAASVPAETRLLSRRIAEALACTADPEAALSGPFLITRPSGEAPLLVTVIPLPPPAFPIWQMGANPRALVLITDPASIREVSAAGLCAVLGFTPAEARVAAMVTAGAGVPQVAAAIGVSPATVKTQLANCFEKTGLHSQMALARLINGFPASPAPTSPAPGAPARSAPAEGASAPAVPEPGEES